MFMKYWCVKIMILPPYYIKAKENKKASVYETNGLAKRWMLQKYYNTNIAMLQK